MANLATNTAEMAEDIRGIKPPVEIPSIWSWVVVILVALVVAALVWWAWRKWRNRPDPASQVRVIPPHEKALAALQEALRLIAEPRPYCQAVSDAVRVYLEERFELHAPERTTEEFLFELQSTPRLTFSQKQSLANFLERCDLVKFAKFEPPQTALRDLHEAALKLISETEPPPLSKPGEAELAGVSAP